MTQHPSQRRTGARSRPAQILLAVLVVLVLSTGGAAAATSSPDDPDGTLRHDGRPVPTTIEEITERLREDPVLVESVLGNGTTEQARERIRAVVAQSALDVPIYAVLTTTVPGLNESDPGSDLAIRLHSRLGDGVYIIALSDGVIALEAWGVPDELGLSSARYDALESAHRFVDGERGLSSAAIVEIMATIAAAGPPWAYDPATIERIASDPANARPDTDRSDDDQGNRTPGGRAMLATVTFLGVLLLGLRLLLWIRAAAGSGTPVDQLTITDTDSLRATAESALDRLVKRLRTAGSSERADAALHDRAAAEALLSAVDRHELLAPDDPDGTRHLVGVLVLARSGLAELDQKRRRDTGPYRACFLNPLHGEAKNTVDFEIAGTTVPVPACATCRTALRKDRTPAAFVAPAPRRLFGSRLRPYYTEDGLFAETAYGTTGADFASAVLQAAAEPKERAR